MQKIEAVELKNFQSHLDSRLEFDADFNVITGPSDQGKSAIVRALRWVLYNEPLGDEFIKAGHKECQVRLELDNGFKIIRRRTPSKNGYIIVDPDGEQQVFERIGREVPPEITNLHQMPKVELDTDYETTLNVDYQLDGPFLLTESGSNRAKALGRMLDVHLIDAASRSTNTEISRIKQQEKELTAEVGRLEEELQEFTDLEKLAQEIENKEKLLAEIKDKQQRLARLKSLRDKWNTVQEKIARLQKIKQEIGDLQTVKDKLVTAEETRGQFRSWEKLSSSWQQKEKKIRRGQKYLRQFAQLDQLENLVPIMKDKVDKIVTLKRLTVNYEKLQEQLEITGRLVTETAQLDKAAEVIATGEEKIDNLEVIINLQQKWSSLEQKISRQQRLAKAFPPLEEQQQIKNKIDVLQEKLTGLTSLSSRWQEVNGRLNKGQKFLQNVIREKTDWLEEYSQVLNKLGRCPTCFSEVDESLIEQIIANYREE
jgi:exonuclease SbcC